jgi:hypothetical protein
MWPDKSRRARPVRECTYITDGPQRPTWAGGHRTLSATGVMPSLLHAGWSTPALERITDSSQTSRHVRYVPTAEVGGLFDRRVGDGEKHWRHSKQ